ncbi:MAG: DUF1801 domain-containing protein [Anaeroplasmataceae bacterium]|nr:DUF1801 domain-containing protein [Anaeroplasmataceae bacterium]MDE6414265.1 DUF1801 domain-containing protein [Anaeroplasmataceae bacterium]
MFDEYVKRYPEEIQEIFHTIVNLVRSSVSSLETRLWAGLPSFYSGSLFVRVIPFKNHINIEASALEKYKKQLQNYKFTPKDMLQIYLGQSIPSELLIKVFAESLTQE